MKQLMMVMAAALVLLTSCSKEPTLAGDVEDADTLQTVVIRFEFPQVTQQAMTRGSLSDANLTDLWLFDYQDGSLVKTIHQQATDDDFGTVAVSAETASHAFCFVASRGSEATVTDGEVIWEKPSDTFWSKVTLNVTPQTATAQTVELQRVATRLRITVTDEVPTALAKLRISADQWHCGIDALTGEPTTATQRTATINVPSSYAGTTGQLSASIFGLCSDDYTTDVSVTALNSSGATIASVSLDDVPMAKNKTTQYSGPLFKRQQSFALTAADSWLDDVVLTW